jgi:predicted AlkP superfamily phosphohydrolase/phosphomutase
MSDKKRVMLIGWDSVPPKLIFDDLRAVMPNTSALLDRSTFGPLRSTDPPITVPAWTSMFSSVNPGGLGFFGFRNLRKGTYDGKWIATADAVHVDRVWDIASRHGKRCCILNVPQTYPPRPLNGALVADFLTPNTDSEFTYPASLRDDVQSLSGGYMLDIDGFRTEDKNRLLSDIYRMTDGHFAVAREMLSREAWDLFMYVEMGPDRLHHGFWKYADPTHIKYEPGNKFETCLIDYYRHLDEQLGELLSLAGDDTSVVLMSDHGTKRMDGNFHINDWLREEGFLQLKEKPDRVRDIKPDLIDWRHTIAWAWGGYYARVFMNVEGREPEGLILQRRYKGVRQDLIERLEAATDHTGRRMNTRALRPEDIYTGEHVADAPDLLVYFDDLYWRAGQDVGHDGLYSFDTEIGPDDAVHDYFGILAVHEAGQQGTSALGEAKAVDVAPTILNLLGIEAPRHFEGRSLIE